MRVSRNAITIASITAGTGLGIILGWLAIREVEWHKVWEALRTFPPALFIAALVIVLASLWIRALRWVILLQNPALTIRRILLVENASTGLNNLTPFRVLTIPIMIAILVSRDGYDMGRITAVIAATRILDLAVTLLALSFAIFLIPAIFDVPGLNIVGIIASVIAIAILLLAFFGAQRVPLLNRIKAVHTFVDAFREFKHRPKILIQALLLSFILWILIGISAWIISIGTDYPVALHIAALVVFIAFFFGTSVPGPPAAVGTYDAPVIFLLSTLLGAPLESAVLFAILTHILLFLPQIVIALVVLPKEGFGSAKNILHLMRKQ